MLGIFRTIILLLMLIGWSLAALALHVVRGKDAKSGNERWVLIPKDRLAITDIYADVRGWTLADLPRHAPLVRRLVASGKADVLAHLFPDTSPARLSDELLAGAGNPEEK